MLVFLHKSEPFFRVELEWLFGTIKVVDWALIRIKIVRIKVFAKPHVVVRVAALDMELGAISMFDKRRCPLPEAKATNRFTKEETEYVEQLVGGAEESKAKTIVHLAPNV